MVRILYDDQGRKEYAVGQDDLDFFFGEVMGRVMRPQLPPPLSNPVQVLPEPAFPVLPAPQRLLMPSPDVLPEPHPAVMPDYVPQQVEEQVEERTEVAQAKRPSIAQFVFTLVCRNKRHLILGGLSFATVAFLLFAGSFVVRKVQPETSIEVGPAEAIGDGEVKGAEAEAEPEAESPAEPAPEESAPAPAFNVPTFPLIPR